MTHFLLLSGTPIRDPVLGWPVQVSPTSSYQVKNFFMLQYHFKGGGEGGSTVIIMERGKGDVCRFFGCQFFS